MIGTWPAGIPNLMALNSSPAIEVLAYRGLDPLQTPAAAGVASYRFSVSVSVC